MYALFHLYLYIVHHRHCLESLWRASFKSFYGEVNCIHINIVCSVDVAYHMTDAVSRFLWSFRGVMIGSPNNMFPMKLPAKHINMDDM